MKIYFHQIREQNSIPTLIIKKRESISNPSSGYQWKEFT